MLKTNLHRAALLWAVLAALCLILAFAIAANSTMRDPTDPRYIKADYPLHMTYYQGD
jgi:hypothetical protein